MRTTRSFCASVLVGLFLTVPFLGGCGSDDVESGQSVPKNPVTEQKSADMMKAMQGNMKGGMMPTGKTPTK